MSFLKTWFGGKTKKDNEKAFLEESRAQSTNTKIECLKIMDNENLSWTTKCERLGALIRDLDDTPVKNRITGYIISDSKEVFTRLDTELIKQLKECDENFDDNMRSISDLYGTNEKEWIDKRDKFRTELEDMKKAFKKSVEVVKDQAYQPPQNQDLQFPHP